MARIYSLLCIVIIVIFSTVTVAVDYCKLESCNEKRSTHTMCKFPSSKPAAACGQNYKAGLNNDEKIAVLKAHNQLRQKVASGKETRGNPGPQPAAVRMPDLTWDNELEDVAQRWASQCNFNHDQCRDVDRFVVGQNIGKSMSSGKTPPMENMVHSWYDEVKKFDRNKVSKYEFEPETGHYTQVVWAKTTKLGCGSMLYRENGWNTSYLVCNYGPSGNWIGEKIYEQK